MTVATLSYFEFPTFNFLLSYFQLLVFPIFCFQLSFQQFPTVKKNRNRKQKPKIKMMKNPTKKQIASSSFLLPSTWRMAICPRVCPVSLLDLAALPARSGKLWQESLALVRDICRRPPWQTKSRNLEQCGRFDPLIYFGCFNKYCGK